MHKVIVNKYHTIISQLMYKHMLNTCYGHKVMVNKFHTSIKVKFSGTYNISSFCSGIELLMNTKKKLVRVL